MPLIRVLSYVATFQTALFPGLMSVLSVVCFHVDTTLCL